MKKMRTVIVLDAADLDSESSFWAAMFDGHVVKDDHWHTVFDAQGEWRLGVQLAPNHVAPDWPDGTPGQQLHLDLHVEDQHSAHEEAMSLGATVLLSSNLDTDEGHQVYADPAGHPFCIGWGHPSKEELAEFTKRELGRTM